MNIFALNKDPIESAIIQHDKHIVKMILESAQMLCSVYDDSVINEIPYKRVHYNHPCSIWVRTDMNNFYWLVKHGYALCKEYTHRYKKIHKSQAVIKWCIENSYRISNIPYQCMTKFAQAMPDEYKNESGVLAYQNYYISEKLNSKSKWTNRKIPKLFQEKMESICQ